MRWSRRAARPTVAPAGPGGDPDPCGVTWSETFTGWLAFGQTDFNQAMLPEHREPTTAGVSVAIPNLNGFLDAQSDGGIRDAAALPAEVTEGYIRCDPFGGELSVRSGIFRAFVPAGQAEPRDALHLRMRYELALEGPGDRTYTCEGFKLLENDPGYDSWSDTTTLFVTIHDGGEPVAVGVLRISPLAFMRELTTFRGSGPSLCKRIGAVLRYQRFFLTSLARTYAGPPVSGSRPSFPQDRVEPPWAPDRRSPAAPAAPTAPAAPEFARLPGTSLGRSIVRFSVPDLDFPLNLHRLRRLDPDGRPVAPTRGPVLLVPGSGVRAEMYYGQPVGPSCAEFLLGRGYDVWVESWRASIDLPPNPYTLDHAAMIDHPLAVTKILDVCAREGGMDVTLKAVVHCQGSISFMMAGVAGRLDERVTHIVSSAVSLFIDVTQSTWLKQRLAMPLVSAMFPGLDAQWGIRPSTPTAGGFAALAKRMERPCGNPTCQVANYMYGSGWDVLSPPCRRQPRSVGHRRRPPVDRPRGRLHAAEPDPPGGRVKPPRLHRPVRLAAARHPVRLSGHPAPDPRADHLHRRRPQQHVPLAGTAPGQAVLRRGRRAGPGRFPGAAGLRPPRHLLGSNGAQGVLRGHRLRPGVGARRAPAQRSDRPPRRW